MYLDYASQPPPISKLRRMTKWCMVLAGAITGINTAAALITTLITFFYYSMSNDFSELIPGMACISIPLSATVVLLVFQNAVVRGSKAASIAVCVVSALHAFFSAIALLLSIGIAGSENKLHRLLSDPVSLLFILMTILSAAACVTVVVLIIMCHRENSRCGDNPYPRNMMYP